MSGSYPITLYNLDDVKYAMHEDYDGEALLVEPLTGGYDIVKKNIFIT